MSKTKIKIEYDPIKKDALEYFVKKEGFDLSQLLQNKIEELYEEHVPLETKEFINHRTVNEEAREYSEFHKILQ